jgi:diguanylate cyclase
MESEEQRFKATESILKRLVGRLCIACLGLSPCLDQELKKLQGAVRREVTTDELEAIMPALTEAVVALDEKSTVTSAAPIAVSAAISTTIAELPNESSIRSSLSALLVELKRDASLDNQIGAIDEKLGQPLTAEQLTPILSALTEIVSKRIQRIERERQEAEALLGQMVSRLDEISHFVADQRQNNNQVLASSESLNAQLTGEFKAISVSVESGSDLQQIREQVRTRIDTIGHHLKEFHKRETERASTMHQRAEQMQARVAELEAEAQKLQTQLQVEQQMSMIDGLTKIANRLAYDKRIAEELQRWQRFGQSTCLAVWDVDHFKQINDTYGHRAGDRVLCNLASHLKNYIRSTDFIARYGGEEFVILLTGTKLDDAIRLLETMRTNIDKLGFHYRGKPVVITASCGVTEFKRGDSAESVFERADKALYQAKKEGRNRCVTT